MRLERSDVFFVLMVLADVEDPLLGATATKDDKLGFVPLRLALAHQQSSIVWPKWNWQNTRPGSAAHHERA